jgi:hypothetical protein
MRKTQARPRPSQMPKSNTPIHTIRHRSIKASIWRNETPKGPVYNVIVVRGFRVGKQWKDSHSFSYDELPIVAKLICDAHTFITNLRANESSVKRVPIQKMDAKEPVTTNEQR